MIRVRDVSSFLTGRSPIATKVLGNGPKFRDFIPASDMAQILGGNLAALFDLV